MQQIRNIRIQIDDLDTEICQLLIKRQQLVRQLSPLKKQAGLACYCPEREQEIYERIKSFADSDMQPLLVSVYQKILTHSKQSQQK